MTCIERHSMRKSLLFLVVVLAVLLGAAPAWAHVTVSGPGATQGGYAVLTFRVPNEEAKASTTKLVVHFPTDTPIASVLVQPKPGWTFRTVTSKLAQPIKTDDGDTVDQAVSEIDWSAIDAASAIKPGEFDQFQVSVGPLPKADQIAFAAIQTYSDGTVVSWNETAAPGSAEPDHPKPTLNLSSAAAKSTTAKASPSSSTSDGNNDGATILAIVALILAAAALAVAVVSRLQLRSQEGRASR